MNSPLFVLHLFMINILYVVHESLVAKLGAARSGITACKVPVALVIGYGLVQSLNALEHKLDRSRHFLWS